jgi:ubiquinone/menaquinone biosynthesis C-methylase UbiE
MRDYSYFDKYITQLLQDVYPQPEDAGHTRMAQEIIDRWLSLMTTCHSVLDAGCGTGFCQPMFERYGVAYEGICLGKDYFTAQELGHNVKRMDFNFLEYADESVDLIFSRHSLEHSPMPLLTLMEWHRVSLNWLCVVLPNPVHYGWSGQNHYSVMHPKQIEFLLERSGWHIMWTDFSEPTELRYMAEKERRSLYAQSEGIQNEN